MRRLLMWILSAVLAAVLLALPVWAEPAGETGGTWADLNTECTVETDGACAVTVHALLHLAPGTEDFSIPLPARAEEITLTGADCTSRREGDYTMLRLAGAYSGSLELTVRYRVSDTVRDLGDSQEFSLMLLYPRWPCVIRHYAFQVHFPAPFEAMPTIQSGYRQDLIENYLDIRVEEGTVTAVLNENEVLNDHDEMSIRLTLPAGYFDLRFLPGQTVRIDKLLFLGLMLLTVLYWLLFLRSRPILPRRQAMPPVGGNAGEVPYVLTEQRPDLALMAVQWASLGYLTIHRSKSGKLHLERQIDMGNERKSYETAVFRSLFSRGDRCDIDSGEYLRTRDAAVDRASEYWAGRVFRQSGEKVLILRLLGAMAGLAVSLACFDLLVPAEGWRWFLIVPLTLVGGAACFLLQRLGGCLLRRHTLRTIGLALASLLLLLIVAGKARLLLWMLLCILFQLAVGFSVRCGGARTAEGAGLAAELLGYRRYLLTAPASALRANLRADPQYFYQSLPYADALMVGKLFAAGFDRQALEPCDWLDWEGKPCRTAMGFYARYRRLMAGLRGEREPIQYRPKAPRR